MVTAAVIKAVGQVELRNVPDDYWSGASPYIRMFRSSPIQISRDDVDPTATVALDSITLMHQLINVLGMTENCPLLKGETNAARLLCISE